MYWYKNLYFGDNAKEKSKELIHALKHKKTVPDLYVAVLSDTNGNLMDIYEWSHFLTGGPLAKRFRRIFRNHSVFGRKKPYIVGIAIGYSDALELVRHIIDDIYRDTGGFDVAEYFRNK